MTDARKQSAHVWVGLFAGLVVVGALWLYLFTHNVVTAALLSFGLIGAMWAGQYCVSRAFGLAAAVMSRHLSASRNAGIREPGYRLGQKKNLPDFQPAQPVLKGIHLRQHVDYCYQRLVRNMRELDGEYDLQHSHVALESANEIVIRTPTGITLRGPATPVGIFNVRTRTWRWSSHFNRALRAELMGAQQPESSDKNGLFQLEVVCCSENDCWELTSLAAAASQSRGAFRIVSGPMREFVIFATLHSHGTDRSF